jgi:hypothetical protein
MSKHAAAVARLPALVEEVTGVSIPAPLPVDRVVAVSAAADPFGLLRAALSARNPSVFDLTIRCMTRPMCTANALLVSELPVKETVEACTWSSLEPEPVDVPVAFAFMNGFRYMVEQGVRGSGIAPGPGNRWCTRSPSRRRGTPGDDPLRVDAGSHRRGDLTRKSRHHATRSGEASAETS